MHFLPIMQVDSIVVMIATLPKWLPAYLGSLTHTSMRDIAISLTALLCGAALGTWLVHTVWRFVMRAKRSDKRLRELLQKRRLFKMEAAEYMELMSLSPIEDKRTAYQFLFEHHGWPMTLLALTVLLVQVGTYVLLYSVALDDAVRECEEYLRNGETGELELRSERGSGTTLEELGYAMLVLIAAAHFGEDLITSIRLLRIGSYR